MTLQPNLSKVLTMIWTTEKPFRDRCRESPDFCLRDTTWYLEMESDVYIPGYPNPYYRISLIERESRNPEIPFNVMTGVDRNSGNSYYFRNLWSSITVTSHKVTIWRREMKSMISDVDDFQAYAELMVVCVFRDVAPSACLINSETNDLSCQTDIERPLTSHLPPTLLQDEKCELDNLSADLSSLLEQQHLADLTLTCKGRSFAVHRSILVARSGVFARMFALESVENESPPVDIPDIDDDIFEMLLKFVYSGKIPRLNGESAKRLWAAGRMYAVHGLQKACLEWMIRNLSKENCVAFLSISDESDDEAYENAVMSFIVSHPDVLKSENWKKFSKAHPKLAVKVFEKFFSSEFDKSNLGD